MIQHLTLFVDLDGVLADFDSHFKNHHGKLFSEFEDGEAWDLLKQIPDFWLNLNPMPEADAFLKSLQNYAPVILLSSPGSHDEKRARYQKRLWANKHLGAHIPLLMCPAKDKCKFAGRGRVLIDDMVLNTAQWREAGGISILHISAEYTLQQLNVVANSSEYLSWLASPV